MSFSQDIKDEIITKKITRTCCISALRLGELVSENSKIDMDKDILKNIDKKLCCKKAYIKGVFLGSGCIINPEKDYHFEVSFKSKKYAEYTEKILSLFDIEAKMIKRNNSQYVVYIKDSEQISTIIRILEANKSLLEFENIRVEKSIKNDINRSINCETANMTKTMETAIVQIDAIDKIIQAGEYNALSLELQEMSTIRKKYPEASLNELASKCKNKISKSGVNHRLKKIIKIAGEL